MSPFSNSTNYNKIRGKKSLCCGGMKGFRLKPRRFYVSRLRRNFMFFFRVVRRWRNSYKKALRRLRGKLAGKSNVVAGRQDVCGDGRKVGFGYNGGSCHSSGGPMRTMAHSNSFCSEAIADCLEFIKRNSVSAEDETSSILIKQE
ncbi:cytochrome b561/ferric reductase transmembrane [Striga asiatica]|uniref:Cytochrome b561/ferric reductase transmembrane n=1 Tax=Striga asiatica TaxID=4170 RepID=A0A5A7P0C3_STRAF|nr:cytochrome b561/ferric reductase transmembrane [Striga asiatica]